MYNTLLNLDFSGHTKVIAFVDDLVIMTQGKTLGKSGKLEWGLGHKSLKTIYEGALIPILTYVVPAGKEAVAKHRNLRKLQRAHRLINIKIAKAYRTISFEASYLMAAVPPIGIIIVERVQLYKRKHCTERNAYECDLPSPVTDWFHPAQRVSLTVRIDLISYATEI